MRKNVMISKIIINVCAFRPFPCTESLPSSPTSFPSIHRTSSYVRTSHLACAFDSVSLCNWFVTGARAVITHFIASFAYKSIMTLTKENSFKLKFLQSHTHTDTQLAFAWNTRMQTDSVLPFQSHPRSKKHVHEISNAHISWTVYTVTSIPFLVRFFLLDKRKRKEKQKKWFWLSFLHLVVSDRETVHRYFIFKSVIFDNTVSSSLLLSVFFVTKRTSTNS